jgi:hypothetical protein
VGEPAPSVTLRIQPTGFVQLVESSSRLSNGERCIESRARLLGIDALFGEVCVVEFVESVSNRSFREQCFLGDVLCGQWLVVLEDAKHELRAG